MPQINNDMTFGLQSKSSEKLNIFEGIALNIQNLDDEIDEEKLCEEFSRFGTILTTKVIQAKSNSMRCGVINFQSPAEAAKAISGMNGGVILNNTVYVTLATTSRLRERRTASRTSSVPITPRRGRSITNDCIGRKSSWGSLSSSSSSLTSLGSSPGTSLIDFKRSLCRSSCN